MSVTDERAMACVYCKTVDYELIGDVHRFYCECGRGSASIDYNAALHIWNRNAGDEGKALLSHRMRKHYGSDDA